MKYNIAYKHLEKITKKARESRPILKGIKHKENTMVATDSFRLLKATIDNMQFDEHVLSTHTNEVIENGKYPNTDKIIPESENSDTLANITFNDIKAIRSLLKVAKQLKFDHVRIETEKDNYLKFIAHVNTKNTEIETLSRVDLSIRLHSENLDQDTSIILNIDFMIDVFEFLHDTKKETTLAVYNNLRPILFESKDYSYIVTPIRPH